MIDADGTFEKGPVRIIDSRDQVLRSKTVRLVKVLWQHRGIEEATWEREDTMRANYPFLFEEEGMFLVIDIKCCCMCMRFVCACVCEFWDEFFFKGERM